MNHHNTAGRAIDEIAKQRQQQQREAGLGRLHHGDLVDRRIRPQHVERLGEIGRQREIERPARLRPVWDDKMTSGPLRRRRAVRRPQSLGEDSSDQRARSSLTPSTASDGDNDGPPEVRALAATMSAMAVKTFGKRTSWA